MKRELEIAEERRLEEMEEALVEEEEVVEERILGCMVEAIL